MKKLLLILFLSNVTTLSFAQIGDTSDLEVFDFPDVDARFPGGPIGLRRWIDENTHYPSGDYTMEEASLPVYVSFVVMFDGSLTQIRIGKGTHPDFNREVERLLGIMPNWEPAKMGSVDVNSRVNMNIRLLLE